MNIGDRFVCIKDVEITGMGKIFTAFNVYISEYKNCLTNNEGCKYTIVNTRNFDFKKHFKKLEI